MTTVIWNEGVMLADTRTMKMDFTTQEALEVAPDEKLKIVLPKELHVGGERIEAIGVAGDSRLIDLLQAMDWMQVNDATQEKIIKDMANPAFHDQYHAMLQLNSHAIIITKEFAYHLETVVANGGGDNWRLTKHYRDTPMMIGSGAYATHAATQDMMRRMASLTKDQLQSKTGNATPGEKSMAVAMMLDKATGGRTVAWQGGCSLTMVDLTETVEAVKVRYEEILALTKHL